ncbi:MAG: MurR/RpiR family transcriptional regulator [Oscillospiraceae bacterium]|nr:MurR/RpiR family transcriptional regulator [Oscillospiraceae bacterium]
MADIIKLIREAYPGLSSAKKSAASYFLNHYTALQFSTVTELAEQIGVSDTTIINLCADLGFGGFSSFKRAVREDLQQEKSSPIPSQLPENSGAAMVAELAAPLIESLQTTFSSSENMMSIAKGAELMAKAKTVYAIGFWSFSALAKEFCLHLRRQGWKAEAIYPDMGDHIDKVLQITSEDVVIAYDFSLYINSMMEICQILRKQNVPIILITDMGPCPCLPYATLALHCHVETSATPSPKYAFSHGAIAGYLLMRLAHQLKPQPLHDYEQLREGVFSRFNPYGVVEPKGGYTERI